MSASGNVLLPHSPSSVGAARRVLGADLRAHGVPESSLADAALVLSELMSNAIRHARPLPSGRVRVSWRLAGRSVQVAVTDGGGPTRPYQLKPPSSAAGGRGLDIVGRVSCRWGVRRDELGTTVWAVLPASTRGMPGPSRAEPRGTHRRAANAG